jgi:hypothetical protein
MTTIRFRQLFILIGCVLGAANVTSLLLVLAATIYFGDNFADLSAFMPIAFPIANLCGAAIGIAIFARTPGRGYLRGLAHSDRRSKPLELNEN